MIRPLGRYDRGVGDEGEVDPWVGHEIRLKFGKVDVEGAVETQ